VPLEADSVHYNELMAKHTSLIERFRNELDEHNIKIGAPNDCVLGKP
jgi:hypothetical protein